MIYHVPARVWTLARLAAAHGWEVRVAPGETQCDINFWRYPDWLFAGWHIKDGKVRLSYVSYRGADVRLRDVPAILTGRAVLDAHCGAS